MMPLPQFYKERPPNTICAISQFVSSLISPRRATMVSELVKNLCFSSVQFAAPAGPRLIVVPFPLQGHITPLLQLSKHMASQGLSVSFVTSRYCISKITSSKQSLSTLQLPPGIDLVGIDDGYGEFEGHDTVLSPEKFIESLEILHLSFVKLFDKIVGEDGIRIACIISDAFLLWMQDAANRWRRSM